jgi:hypothetical protein
MTGGPVAGPASAYPIFRTPASICFSAPNDVFAPAPAGGEAGVGAHAATDATDADATVAAKARENALLLSKSNPPINRNHGDTTIGTRRPSRERQVTLSVYVTTPRRAINVVDGDVDVAEPR